MNTIAIPTIQKEQPASTTYENIEDFYAHATPDYLFWDKQLNMHFGYCNHIKDIFNREKMIESLNQLVYNQFNFAEGNVADLGCGMGGAIQFGVKNFPKIKLTGFTISAYQAKKGQELITTQNAKIKCEDYNQLPSKDGSFNGVYAIESFCHSGCSQRTLQEAHRVLKSGGKLVIADGFTTKQKRSKIANWVHDGLCNHWFLNELGNIDQVKLDLEKIGFQNIKIQDISWRIAPSVLHVPFAVCAFVIKQLCQRKKLEKHTIHNLKGSAYSWLSGLYKGAFGYYLVTAEKV